MNLYKNKYRAESARLKAWDYSSNGRYYITICVNNHECVFGYITARKMVLSNLGKNAESCWREIPHHFPFVKLDEYVVMPNHIHGIIVIEKTVKHRKHGESAKHGESVETQNLASLQSNVSESNVPPSNVSVSNMPPSNFGPQSKNIASIIRGFKIGVTKYAVNNNIPFKWQPRFHDHIIRDENDLNRIRKYIMNNPLNWGPPSRQGNIFS